MPKSVTCGAWIVSGWVGRYGWMLGRAEGEENVLCKDWNSKIWSLEFETWQWMVVWWLWRPTATAKAVVRSPRAAKFVLSYCDKIGLWRRAQGNHEVVNCSWRQLTLAEREKLKVWKQWNWFRLAECWGWVVNLYCLCGGLLEVGSLAKRSCMFGWLGQLLDGLEIFMRWEQVGMGGDSTKSFSPVHVVDRYDWMWGHGGTEKIV